MLKLTGLELSDPDSRLPSLDFKFNVIHNVGALPTTLEFDLLARIDRDTGKVSASLKLDELEANSLDEARQKMAIWCARTSVALSNVDRVPGDVPTYEKRSFELDKQPSWVRAEFERLTPRFAACALADAAENPREILAEMVSEGNPLVYLSGAYDLLEAKAYPDD